MPTEVTLEAVMADMQIIRDQNEKLHADNQKLLEQLAKKEKTTIEVEAFKPPTIPKESFEIGKKSYKFQVAQFTVGGNTYKAEDLFTDSSSETAKTILQGILKTEGQGILKEVK